MRPSSVVVMGEALELWDSHQVAAAAAACVRAERAAGCRLLELAALWADHHPAGGILHRFTDLAVAGEESARFGGDGTPEVAEFAPAELGVEIGVSPGQARMLIADALDLRHRLPRLWGRVQAGQVPARDARRVAARTRLLTLDQAMVVDRRVVRVVGQLSWTRLEHLLAAEILRVDRVRVEQETENAKRFRYIRTGQGSEYGLTEVSMLVDTPDAILLKAATKRLADILMGRADDLPAGVPDRGARSKAEWQAVAAGILAQPALALQVLAQVDQPDLFTDLEAHLQVADHQPAATELPASDLPMPDLSMPDEPGSEDPGPGLDPQPEAEPSRAERREAVMKDLARRIDPDKLTPRVVLHVHIGADALPAFDAGEDPGVARVEGIGPVLLASVREWLGRAAGSGSCRCSTRPRSHLPTATRCRTGWSRPYWPGPRPACSPGPAPPAGTGWTWTTRCPTPDPPGAPPGAPPGQTRLGNLGPLARGEHRYKTFGPINVTQPVAGTFVWRTRFGRVIITNPAGTHDLGTGTFADTVWQTSADRAPSPAV